MRVNALRMIAIALGVVLIDIDLYGYQLLPDVAGLAVLLFIAILMLDRAGRFARMAVVTAVMGFLEVIRIFSLTDSLSVISFFGLLYLFLKVLLVITAADSVGQYGQLQGYERVPRLCDVTGHVYALTFLFSALAMWLDSLSRIFALVNTGISLLVIVMFLYFYSIVVIDVQKPFDPPAAIMDDGEGPEIGDAEAGEEAGEETGNEPGAEAGQEAEAVGAETT
ncbi:MAG: hypothetical protein LBI19_06595 [Oscillospiraceae bacterium]|jgi:hypothetical protein|nr:hypothetical protein [Oscillospiraceae bacterium]